MFHSLLVKYYRAVLITIAVLAMFSNFLLAVTLLVLLIASLVLDVYLEHEEQQCYTPERVAEFEIKPMEIPSANGKEYIQRENEPSDEQLEAFFANPETWQRLFYSNKMLVDQLDDWEMFGYQPGFVFIQSIKYKGVKTFAEEAFLTGKLIQAHVLTNGMTIQEFEAEAIFPWHKYNVQRIVPNNTPKTYAWLMHKLQSSSLLLPEKAN